MPFAYSGHIIKILTRQGREMMTNYLVLLVVREERLELSRVSPLDPKSSASANSATLAQTKDRRRPTVDRNSKTTDL